MTISTDRAACERVAKAVQDWYDQLARMDSGEADNGIMFTIRAGQRDILGPAAALILALLDRAEKAEAYNAALREDARKAWEMRNDALRCLDAWRSGRRPDELDREIDALVGNLDDDAE